MELLSKHFHKTRIAPTPSGFLHLGNVLSFALTAYLARQAGASVLLRIDDLDRERVAMAYIQDIFDTLDFLQLPWHEGPVDTASFEQSFSQRHRLHLYTDALTTLEKSGRLFACTCSRSQIGEAGYPGTCRNKNIPLDTPGSCWRLKATSGTVVRMKNIYGTVIDAALPGMMQDFIVRKKNGTASYQLASVCDDLYYQVDMVIRGEDLYQSTVAQLYLAELLDRPAFAEVGFWHHPLLLHEGNKLSKTAGAPSVLYLRKEGFSPAAIYEQTAAMAGLRVPARNWDMLAQEILAGEPPATFK
jgi:glutamyl/glutaminyl-tRNA synthetase